MHLPVVADNDIINRRDKILRLTNEGKTGHQVAKLLGVSKTTIDREKKFLRHSGQVLMDSRTFRWISILKAVAGSRTWFSDRGIKPTLRTIFYKLVSLGLLSNTKSEYNSLSTYTGIARKGVDRYYNEVVIFGKLPIDCFVDEGRYVTGIYQDNNPIEPTPTRPPEDPRDYIDNAIRDLKAAPGDYTGKCIEGRRGSNPGRWYNQPYYVEVWIEKAALAGTFQNFLRNKGYQTRR